MVERSSSRGYMVSDAADDGGDKKLSAQKVREALPGRSTAAAAALLGVHHQTLRNRFPHLLNKRRTPSNRKDEKTIEMVHKAASDPAIGYRELARSAGISSTLAKRICDEQGFQWQTRQVKHPVPPPTTPIPARSAGDDRPGGPVHQTNQQARTQQPPRLQETQLLHSIFARITFTEAASSFVFDGISQTADRQSNLKCT
ncbi:hypothetical protein [Pseudorhizobium pelagicum]|uniref:hypothetical protein n=1 Tax=Pseudorhizobium pelagicum TaxID=1509405 RepID=UPI001110FF3F|nr:hypothetical protein [Pseudorhizobium pelagicum]